ncbi:helix-turn-helix transcriptional regulator [Glaesserella parasuis]|uniref:helix-turn-helix domain-containing protein n=1 Tax=Glaesserella parasuis TaxID=738 RepID=UPI002436BE77|nr:helix-turn-helix transcriptional regulator [Glaesserella parasuis]MDG6473283.1 helix-turn-helix transcriptional regulator [Glaesserella parasuis]MDO9798505.1 helix-turn-helix transcriptional regulator [Glaesserella parasuis]MDO9850427.1 helix-turn-helix transcriptional regulator [Glaesserella parasuis]MDO9863858.1 helix-turn-helix transcriptional regulator [Glaesserella parasuis]MDO9881771.1 helix-turn-helix transcriptional regulator [Glaesserella parasuis]
MSVNEKIRMVREMNQWSQEEMAAKMNMSTNGYAKIERGETKLNLHKLEQIAQIFNIDVLELMNCEGKGVFLLMNENGNNTNYCGNPENFTAEIEKLKLTIAHKDEMLAQKNEEIIALKEIISLLKKKDD